jgi:signal transduction histidine kinase
MTTLLAPPCGRRLERTPGGRSNVEKATILEALDNSSLAIVAVGTDGRVSYESHGAEMLFGKIVGMDLSNPPPNDNPGSPLAAIQDVWNGQEGEVSRQGAPRILRAKMEGRPTYLWLQVLPLGAGSQDGRLLLCSDLTSIITGAEPVRALISQLAHDLRSPLTSISGAAELLLSGRVGELAGAQHRLVKIVGEGTQKLAIIIRNASEESREGGAAE